MEYDSVESLLTYLGNYITSEESNKEDGAADDSELVPDPGVNRTSTPSSNILNSSESIPNAEALRYLAYVPVVIDDEEDNIQHRSSPRLQQEWRRPPPPNLNVPHSGKPVSFKDPKREAFLKASLLRRFEGIRPKTGPIRGFRMPFRPRSSPVPILKGSQTQQIRSFGKEDIQHFPPISNQKVSSRNGNFADQLDSLQGEQSQMQQFSSIQDIIRHIDDRPRSRSSTSRRREKIVRPKNVQSLDSKRRYSFMMDLYPLGGKVNPMMFTEESRFDESGKGGDPRSRYRNQNRDMNYEKRFQNGGYRQRGPSVRYEEEKPEEDEEEDDYSGSEEETTATESSYAKPKGKGGKNDSERLKFQNYESNGGMIQQREWNPRPRFTIDDIIQILTAAGKIASNRRSSVLPVLPRDIWRSPDPGFLNKWNNEDSSMDLQAVESNQNRLLTKQGYWNSSNRYGYENIHNHAPEPLPDPEAATVRITSIGTRKRN
ncbi:hypothetical protein QYM36_004671 [Artemia franciscana]|nr:hypothetical protein QYM36_004671 [Artemia franciscana]